VSITKSELRLCSISSNFTSPRILLLPKNVIFQFAPASRSRPPSKQLHPITALHPPNLFHNPSTSHLRPKPSWKRLPRCLVWASPPRPNSPWDLLSHMDVCHWPRRGLDSRTLWIHWKDPDALQSVHPEPVLHVSSNNSLFSSPR
jgi:hypothetical protein